MLLVCRVAQDTPHACVVEQRVMTEHDHRPGSGARLIFLGQDVVRQQPGESAGVGRLHGRRGGQDAQLPAPEHLVGDTGEQALAGEPVVVPVDPVGPVGIQQVELCPRCGQTLPGSAAGWRARGEQLAGQPQVERVA